MGASLGRQHQALVVGMGHDQAADEARAHAPTGLPDVFELPFLVLELHVEGLAEVLAQVVAGAGLQRQAVLHHGLDGVAAQRAGELFGSRLHALDHRHGHDVFGHLGVDIEHAQHFFQRFLVGGVGGVAFLPEEFGGAQEQARAQLPAHHVGPLVDQQRQVAPALNPAREEMADDGLRGGPDDVRLFQFLAAGDGHHGQFGRETLHVLGLFAQEALRNQQREIGILVAGGLEAAVELLLEALPDGVAVGLDDHAALDDFGGLRHVSLEDNVLVPGSEILGARGDGGFGHVR